jgi:hypothetical protein
MGLPTACELEVFRVYGGTVYPRASRVFGEREPISLKFVLRSMVLGLPVPNVDVGVYLDGVRVATARTNWNGEAWFTFQSGIPRGSHTVRCSWAGDFWNAPCEASVDLRTVAMDVAYFKSYVDATSASPSMVEAKVMDDLLRREVGATVTKVEVDTERSRYIMTVLVAEEPTTPVAMPVPGIVWAIAIILGAIAAALFAFGFAVYITIVYVVGYSQCGICGKRFTTCEALREHIIAEHPDIWEKIKDKFECAPPAAPVEWWKVLMIAGVAIAGVFAAGYIIKALRK